MNIFRVALLSFFLVASIGCAGTMQTARTNGTGNFQFGVEPGATILSSSEGSITAPSFNLAGRYGITDTIDLGARIGTALYEIQSKFMLTDPNDQSGIAMSIAPSFTAIGAGTGDGGSFYLGTKIPFLIGIPVGDSELTIAPRLSPSFITAGSGDSDVTGFILSGGGSVGFAARLGDTFWILPEISVEIPFVGGATASSGDSSSSEASAGFGGSIINIGVGLLFGGRPAYNGTNVMPPATNTGGTVIP